MSEGTPTGDAATPPAPATPPVEAAPPTPPASPPGETTFNQADVERIVNERLARERKKYSDYSELKEQASKTKTVEEQLAEVRKAMTDRDLADVERNGRLALAQAKAAIAQAGLKHEDVAGLFDLVPATALLVNGEPDDKAIDKFVKSVIAAAGRATPDPDQGRKATTGPVDMNTLIRQRAGVTS